MTKLDNPSGELAQRLVAQLLQSGAENYLEQHFDLTIDDNEQNYSVMVLLNLPGQPSPHELRTKAEAERNTLQAELASMRASAKPVQVDYVAVMRDSAEGGVEPEWSLEGGTAELMAGMYLCCVDGGALLFENGSGELYTTPSVGAEMEADCEIGSAQLLAIARGAAQRCSEQHAYMVGAKEDPNNWFPHQWVIDAMRQLLVANNELSLRLRGEVKRLEASEDKWYCQCVERTTERDRLTARAEAAELLLARVIDSGALSKGQFEGLEADICASVDILALAFFPIEQNAEPVLRPAVSPSFPDDSRYTYCTTQETNCAGCGVRKHTPLRVDWMGGYVCLTCIDTKLDQQYAELNPDEDEACLDQSDTRRLDFMLEGHRKLVIERLPSNAILDKLSVYVEEGFLAERRYPAVAFYGDWKGEPAKAAETKRNAIDAAFAEWAVKP